MKTVDAKHPALPYHTNCHNTKNFRYFWSSKISNIHQRTVHSSSPEWRDPTIDPKYSNPHSGDTRKATLIWGSGAWSGELEICTRIWALGFELSGLGFRGSSLGIRV